MIPLWLHIVSVGMLCLGGACAIAIAIDEFRNPQPMWIMNIVWPVTALFGSVVWLWAYMRFGRAKTEQRQMAENMTASAQSNTNKPFWAAVGEGASHCGSGCTLGDICAEWLAFGVPAVAMAFGWHTLFADKIFAVWVLDYIFAYLFGIVFQYFTIAPMRSLSFTQGLWAAVKADTLSLTAWQIGMYGFMAIAYFFIFRTVLDTTLQVNSAEFWFMMQIAMLFGFLTSYPVNWWLIRKGLKEVM